MANSSGLTMQQAQNLQKTHGFNEVVSIEIPEWRKFLMRYVGVVPFLMLLTAIVSVAIAEVCDEEELLTRHPRCDACTEGMRDWVSFALLIFEMNLIAITDYLTDKSASDAVKTLKAMSAPTCWCKRDGSYVQLPVRELVPGDVIELMGGLVVPCDCVVVGEGEPVLLDESSLTGETLAVSKQSGEESMAGAVVLQGERQGGRPESPLCIWRINRRPPSPAKGHTYAARSANPLQKKK